MMTTREKVKLFFEPVKVNKTGFLILSFYSVSIGFTNVYFIVFLEYVAKAIENGDKAGVIFRCLWLGGLVLYNYILRIFIKPQHFKVTRDLLHYLETKYLEEYLGLDNNDAEKIGTGRFISIMKKGIDVWDQEIIGIFWDKAILGVSIVLSLIYIAKSSGNFLLCVLAIILFAIPWIGFFGKKAIFYRLKSKDIRIEGDRIFIRWLMSKFEILQQGKLGLESSKKYELWKGWAKYKFKEKIWQGLGYDTVMFIANIFIVYIALVVGIGSITGSYSLSDFVLLTGLGTIFTKNLFQILQQTRKSIDAFIHVTKLRDTFSSLKTIQGYDEGETFTYNAGGISIRDITYSYGENPVFQNFSLDIEAGKKTAFVGLSGAGKTTLIKLLAGYLQVDKGSIIVDGQDLNDVALKTYYQSVGYLTQEPSVFDGTIRENLLYSLPEGATIESIQKRVDEILGLAKCDFVYDLPDGIDTEIGERGIRLSGGQKQRLAIAKIFLKDPKIVILDEPTSALDSFSEEAITEAMHNLYKGRTVLIIAHRLQTVKEADTIVVLDYNKKTQSSELIEQGTHDELVKKKGFYARMLEVQTGF